MSSGEIRKGKENSEQIPLDTPIWFVLLTVKKGKIEEEVYQATKDGRSQLYSQINELKRAKKYFKIYGVWTGKWNTDLFDMDITILKRRLKEAGLYSWAK